MIRAAIALVAVVALLASCTGSAVDDVARTPAASAVGDAAPSPAIVGAPAATPATPELVPSGGGTGVNPADQAAGRSPSPSITPEERAATTPALEEPAPTARPRASTAPGTARPSAGASFSATPIEAGGPGQLTGVLGFDSVEGGCLYVETGTGTRFELLLPATWHMDVATRQIGGPAGAKVGVGERVLVTGAVTDAIATICQVGPVFRVTGIAPAG